MNKRKILRNATIFLCLVGLALAATPFFASMNPSQTIKNKAKVRVVLSEIPEEGALEVDFQGDKILIVRKPKLSVFLMPYYNGAYRLPDPTWRRAIVPCKKFDIGANGFSCNDPNLSNNWNKNATWDLTGRTASSWVPDLQKAPYKIEGNYILLSPEYK